jgi:protein-S-isoprenylcysteine O-methyltransferase Ste14
LSLIILICGLALWYSGLFYLGKNFHGFSEPKTLITSGIYSKISHPIYLGAILSFIGLSIFSKHTFIILVTLILIPLQLIRASVEQKKLEQKYGEKYIKYKKGTWL